MIQTQRITTSTTSVTVNVTGYENLSGAKLKLTTGPIGTQNDYDMKGRTTLKAETFTGPGSYTFEIDASKLSLRNNVQAYLFSYDMDKDVTTYEYSDVVEISDADPVPSAAITTTPVTNRTTELKVQLKHLPSGGIFRIVELEAGESYDSSKLNS